MADEPKTLTRERTAVGETLRTADDARSLQAAVPPKAMPIEPLVPQPGQQTHAVGQRVTRPDSRNHGLGQTKYIADLP